MYKSNLKAYLKYKKQIKNILHFHSFVLQKLFFKTDFENTSPTTPTFLFSFFFAYLLALTTYTASTSLRSFLVNTSNIQVKGPVRLLTSGAVAIIDRLRYSGSSTRENHSLKHFFFFPWWFLQAKHSLNP